MNLGTGKTIPQRHVLGATDISLGIDLGEELDPLAMGAMGSELTTPRSLLGCFAINAASFGRMIRTAEVLGKWPADPGDGAGERTKAAT
jgi:hypothetical protein